MPRLRATRRASARVPADENGEGMETPDHSLAPERVHRDRRRQRRVDAAREPDHHAPEAVLPNVVAGPGHESRIHLGVPIEEHRRPRRQLRPRPLGQRREDNPAHGRGGASLLLPPPRVAEPRAERCVEVKVGDHQVLLERPAERDAVPRGVEDHRLAVEDQLVLPAHQVHERQVPDVIGCSGRQHLLAEAHLADVVGRRVDRDHQLRAGERLRRHRAGGVPDVLADVHRQDRATLAQLEDRRVRAGLKVAVLVEDAVVREVLLVVHPGDRAVVADGGGVHDVVAAVDEAHHHDEAGRRARHPVEGPQVRLDEGGAEEEVLRGVAREAQLGEGDQIDAERAGPLDRIEHPAGVALDVADTDVELGQADPELSHADPPARSISNRP